MINAGAITTTSLIAGATSERAAEAPDGDVAYAGRPLAVNRTVYESDKETGHRNSDVENIVLVEGV